MTRSAEMHALTRLAIGAMVLWIPITLAAAESRKAAGRAKNAARNVEPETVELFSAMEQGKVQARLIPKDANFVRLVVLNRTDKPLSVQLPEAFGGVPILAQQVGTGTVGNPGSTQALGMAPPSTLFPTNSSLAFLSVPPEGVNQFSMRSVCLERFKEGPTQRTPYEVKPLSKITAKAEIFELCRALSNGGVSLRLVQAAAWHVNNGLDWRQLLHPGAMGALPDPVRFTVAELLGAQRLVEMAEQAVARRSTSTGTSAASSGK